MAVKLTKEIYMKQELEAILFIISFSFSSPRTTRIYQFFLPVQNTHHADTPTDQHSPTQTSRYPYPDNDRPPARSPRRQ